MFRHSFIPTETAKSPKIKEPRVISRPNSPVKNLKQANSPNLRPPSAKRPIYSSMSPNGTGVSQRFNSAYHRLPSPPRVTLQPTGLATGSRNSTVTAGQSTDRRETRRSDGTTLSVPPQPARRVRPKTATITKQMADKSVQESPSFQNNILLTVKDVLEHFIMQKTSIDSSDLDRVMEFIRTRINGGLSKEDVEKEMIRVAVESKRSATSVNPTSSSSSLNSSGQKRFVGFRRKEVAGARKDTYLRFYGQKETLNDEERTLWNKDEHRGLGRNSNSPQKCSQPGVEETVGDSQANNTKPMDLWKAIEELDLKKYIQTLVNNENHEIKTENCKSVEETAKQNGKASQTCESKKITPGAKLPNAKLSGLGRTNASKLSCRTSPTRVIVPKFKSAESSFNDTNGSPGFQAEPKVVFNSFQTDLKAETQTEGTAFVPVSTNESSEDLYLQRRRKRTATKKSGY